MIAIHNGKTGFTNRWISYCENKKIHYKLVNCYDNDIMHHLANCKVLMWHHSQNDPKALIMAKSILFAAEQVGIKVFPNFKTNWHFDDKVGQKYLLEGIGAPIVSTYVFTDKQKALDWTEKTDFPKVFKLRRGAGSANVKLVRTKKDAQKLIKKAFADGFSNYDKRNNFNEILRKFRLGQSTIIDLLKGIYRLFKNPHYANIAGKEVGYVYFQDFIPNNDHDIRVVVISNKAFAIKRLVRKNDFRASGSGHILYDKTFFDENLIKLAFEINNKLQSQCTAMDFVYDNGMAKILEISYGFVPEGYDPCPGYWDENIVWHEGKFDPYGWMLEDLLKDEI